VQPRERLVARLALARHFLAVGQGCALALAEHRIRLELTERPELLEPELLLHRLRQMEIRAEATAIHLRRQRHDQQWSSVSRLSSVRTSW
jgi:hypothetical protein